MNYPRLFSVFGLVVVALLTRFLPHPPNFTAINAIAIFSAYTTGNQRISFFSLFAAMFISDLFLGLHSQMGFVYLSLALSTLLCRVRVPLLFSISASSFFFFVIVNFGVWLLDGIFPRTLTGLGLCYTAALPFLSYQLLGDFFFSALLFGSFSFLKTRTYEFA